MDKSIISNIEKILGIELSEDELNILYSGLEIVSLNKGYIPVSVGETSDYFYFMLKGLVRGYYLDENGNEVTKCFSKENQFFSSECYRTELPATYYVECLEDCSCIRITYATLHKVPKLSEIINVFYVKELENLEKRLRNMLLMNGSERYQEFLRNYSDLDGRIPQKYIASYIGIMPESLSRIRKSIHS